MIIQTAPAEMPRLAIMMHEHNALCHQFAHAFGNDRFATLAPSEYMIYVIGHHDAGWFDFDRDPKIDPKTELPYNLTETPFEFITVTSKLSPEFNQNLHPYCGLISSMHSWGLYNGRYGISNLVLLEKVPPKDRALTDQMLNGELERQARLKKALAAEAAYIAWSKPDKVFENYKLLQFIDTLALYFNRIHPSERVEQKFDNVPASLREDLSVTIRPISGNTYSLTPFPFAASGAEFAFCGRRITAADGRKSGGWPAALRHLPTEWEEFRLIAG